MNGINETSTPTEDKSEGMIVLLSSERAGYKKPAKGFRKLMVVGKAHVIAEKE